jgi:hypothetical protein
MADSVATKVKSNNRLKIHDLKYCTNLLMLQGLTFAYQGLVASGT